MQILSKIMFQQNLYNEKESIALSGLQENNTHQNYNYERNIIRLIWNYKVPI